MSSLRIYHEIMEKYQEGSLGKKPLSLHDIFALAGHPNLMDELSLSDIEHIIHDVSSTPSILRLIFLLEKRKRQLSLTELQVSCEEENNEKEESHRIDIQKIRKGGKKVVEELLRNDMLSKEELKRITGWTPEMFGVDSSLFDEPETKEVSPDEAYQTGFQKGIEICNQAWVKVLLENGFGIEKKILDSFVSDVNDYISQKRKE